MPSAIVVIELKGFTAMATALAQNMERVGVTPERVRAAGIETMREAVRQSVPDPGPAINFHIGGDTWYFTFTDFEVAFQFCVRVLRTVSELTLRQAIFFIKPSVAIGWGEPKTQDDRFLDDDSIATYRVADAGAPFSFYTVGPESAAKALAVASTLAEPVSPVKVADLGASSSIRWADVDLPLSDGEPPVSLPISLPTLLLDSEVMYANSLNEAVGNVIRQQGQSEEALVFGGPVPFDMPVYRKYIQDTVRLLKDIDCKTQFTILCFIPLNESKYSYTWLELCRRLMLRFPQRFAFRAFPIQEGALRPFSYHVYDKKVVHIGLRSFSTHRSTPTMTSAIMFRNAQIGVRFREDFLDNWRRFPDFDEAAFASVVGKLPALSQELRTQAQIEVERLMEAT